MQKLTISFCITRKFYMTEGKKKSWIVWEQCGEMKELEAGGRKHLGFLVNNRPATLVLGVLLIVHSTAQAPTDAAGSGAAAV